MKTAEPLLYTVNVIWVVEDLFWLAVAVSFDFLFTPTYLERLAGCFSSLCHFRSAVDVYDVRILETRRAKFKQKGQIFPSWIITDLFIKIVLSNHTKMSYEWRQSLR